MKLTPQELLRSANRQRLTRAGLLKIMKENERKEKMTLTIRARVNEGVTDEGVGFPESVVVTGAGRLSPDTIREIAQEAVDSFYGEYESGYRAEFAYFNLRNAITENTADRLVVQVKKV